jgi:5'-phosphate synthase pdxT subunit
MKDVVGILALQGDFARHAEAVARAGAEHILVRRPRDLERAARLIIPGGESTTFALLLGEENLRGMIVERAKGGMPVLGTCAGAILVGREVEGDHSSVQVRPLGLIDARVSRNAYGRQVDSFEDAVDVTLDGRSLRVPAVFIRAPKFTDVGAAVDVIGARAGEPVMLRQGKIVAAAFHPELTDDLTIHRYFISL